MRRRSNRKKPHVSTEDDWKTGVDAIPKRFWEIKDRDPEVAALFGGDASTGLSGRDLDGRLVKRLADHGLVTVGQLGPVVFNTKHGYAKAQPEPRTYIAETVKRIIAELPDGLRPGSGLGDVVSSPEFLNPAQDFCDGVAYFAHGFVAGADGAATQTMRVVTSDRRVLPVTPVANQGIVEVPGTGRYTNKTELGPASRWPLERGPCSVRAFVDGDAPRVDPRRRFEAVRRFISNRIWLPEATDYDILSLYVLLSYFYRLFASVPYLHLHGPKGTGKTTIAKLMAGLGFNGELLSNLSPASLFRLIHVSNGLLVLDEVEQLSTRRASAEDIRSDLLKAGYQAGATVARVHAKDHSRLQQFDVYSPKVIANIKGLDDILSDRVVRIQTRTPPRAERWSGKPVRGREHPQWGNYRSHLYVLAMQQHRRVAELLDDVEDEDIGLYGRLRELYVPLIVIARLVEGASGRCELEDRLQTKARGVLEESDARPGPEETLIGILREKLDDAGVEHMEVPMPDLVDAWQQEFGDVEVAPAYIGRLLQTIGVRNSDRKTIDGAKVRVYAVRRADLG